MSTSFTRRKKSVAGMQSRRSNVVAISPHAPPDIINAWPDPYKYAESILEAVQEPVLILDKNLTIRSANKAFFKTFKVTKKQTLSIDFKARAAQDVDVKALTKMLENLSAENPSFEEFEFPYYSKRLGQRTLLVNAKRMLFGKFATDFLLLGIEDITKRKLLDQQKDDFIGYVTHELKTPLTAITAFIQILQGYHDKTGDKKSQFLLGKVATQMDRLTSLLNSFASVYKAQHNKLLLQKSKINLDRLVHETVEAFQYTTNTHELIVKGTITQEITADKQRISEVLVNLIVNAIKYSPKAEKIIIKLSQTDEHVTVSVRDYGFGISKEEQKKVFERFFRVKGKTENKIEGLGLGLYLVAAIIKEHDGKIWVKSNFGEGSTFSFTLPIKS